ncbi:type II toxin-antitoxin system HicB family antitoxin [Halovivax cerinus]|uniref:Uncharacterized protein n=1 Tax=Halovivax cerinus TaxID=1487865 RepID=A0ABD5NLJ5_9EURY|nr:hypothetical protein [Halovivax cerinus]
MRGLLDRLSGGQARDDQPDDDTLECRETATFEFDSADVGGLEQRVKRIEAVLETVTGSHPITLSQENGEWFAEEPDSGVTGNGESKAEAIAQLAEALGHDAGELEFSESFREELDTGAHQIEAGTTHSAEDVRSRLGIDD